MELRQLVPLSHHRSGLKQKQVDGGDSVIESDLQLQINTYIEFRFVKFRRNKSILPAPAPPKSVRWHNMQPNVSPTHQSTSGNQNGNQICNMDILSQSLSSPFLSSDSSQKVEPTGVGTFLVGILDWDYPRIF